MALDLTAAEQKMGEENTKRVSEGLTRRGFMKSMTLAGGAVAAVSAASYFGYKSIAGNPVKAALIGGGDEGGVLVGEHNPEFLKFVAVCDIRPTNMKRIFDGDPKAPIRKGFKKVYGNDAKGIEQITDYDKFFEVLRTNKDIEAIVIALPLHLHAPVAIKAMRIGKDRGKPIHVLTEKLMGWNITSCKKMIAVAKETGSILSVGHQRHYSMLYAQASEVMNSGVLGDVKHIRALWHRNFSWPFTADSDSIKYDPSITQPTFRDGWFPPIDDKDFTPELVEKIKNGNLKGQYDDIPQLVRWRLDPDTGGGLMAELGSHQMDACSIFLGKVHPIAVSGVGVKSFFGKGRNDRDIDDHIFLTLEFPGKNYSKDKNPNDIVVVTYSSVSTNSLEAYGECVMGTRGSMVVEMEQKLRMYVEKDPTKKATEGAKLLDIKVDAAAKGAPALAAASTWGGPAPAAAAAAPGGAAEAPVSKGYREEMEDFAYCIRLWDPKLKYEMKDGKYVQRLPRCHGEVAMADAIIALTCNKAMRDQKRIEFDGEWFTLNQDELTADKDKMKTVKYNVPDPEDEKDKNGKLRTPKVPVE